MPTCNCKLFSRHPVEGYPFSLALNYEHHPCQEMLIYGESDERGHQKTRVLTKTAFSLKHWAFAASLKFIQRDELAVSVNNFEEYRKNYLRTLLHIIALSPMATNMGFFMRSGIWNYREAYFFKEILERGLRIDPTGVGYRSEGDIFPIRYFHSFAPFCYCNFKVQKFCTIKMDSDPPIHYLNLVTDGIYSPTDMMERNGHYDFCSRMNNKIIFLE